MAEANSANETDQDDEFQQGTEPGASRNSMLVATDSLEDIAQYLGGEISEADLENFRRVARHKSTDSHADSDLSESETQTECDSQTVTEINDPGGEASDDGEVLPTENVTEDSPSKVLVQNSSGDSELSPRNRKKQSTGSTSEITNDKNNDVANCDPEPVDITQVNRKLSALSTDDESQDHVNHEEIGSDQYYDAEPESPVITPDEICPELEYVNSHQWKNHEKHVFILSRAGKPIYSRYGEEDKLVTLMGVMQALASFVQYQKDTLRYVVAGDHKFVYLLREHLILVAIARTGESHTHLLLQLTYMYNQVLSILTQSQLDRIFSTLHNYDLRRLLSGTEKLFDNLLNLMNHDPSYFLGAVRCLPLEASVRDNVAQSIAQNAKVKDLVFGIVIANGQLVTLVRMKRYFLHPLDLHLVFNLVSASESFKTAESWTPICLPKFDTSGYLHAYISYLDDSYQSCLLLFTVDKDLFFTLADCKKKILEKLKKHHCLRAISDSIRRGNFTIGQANIPELRHFLYKSRSTAQFTSPRFEAPYNTEVDQQRIFRLYQYLHNRLHSNSRPLKILFHVGPYETLLGWVTSGFELYAAFGPLVTKPIAISSVNKLLKWIKKEEDRLFILNSPTF